MYWWTEELKTPKFELQLLEERWICEEVWELGTLFDHMQQVVEQQWVAMSKTTKNAYLFKYITESKLMQSTDPLITFICC